MTEHNIVHCSFERHAAQILDIFNEAIVNSTALYDYKPRVPQNMVTWFEAKRTGNFPVIGVENSEGELLAFGSYGTFRAWPAYKYTVEHSVYVHKNHRGKGLGLLVMQQLISAARQQDVHAMVGGIDAANTGSIVLHERWGFSMLVRCLRSASNLVAGSIWLSTNGYWTPQLNPLKVNLNL